MMRPRTYQEARGQEGKPLCRFCYIPCDWRTREYRALQLCPYCYDELPPVLTLKKEAVCPPKLSC